MHAKSALLLLASAIVLPNNLGVYATNTHIKFCDAFSGHPDDTTWACPAKDARCIDMEMELGKCTVVPDWNAKGDAGSCAEVTDWVYPRTCTMWEDEKCESDRNTLKSLKGARIRIPIINQDGTPRTTIYRSIKCY